MTGTRSGWWSGLDVFPSPAKFTSMFFVGFFCFVLFVFVFGLCGGMRGDISVKKHARAICGYKSPKPGLNLSGS